MWNALFLYRPATDAVYTPVADILAGLRQQVSSDKGIARFNIARNHAWEGARRGFRRASFNPEFTISVKFTDDIGTAEGAVDEGGPRREFLQLIMDYLASSSLFAGSDTAKHLNLLHTGNNCY